MCARTTLSKKTLSEVAEELEAGYSDEDRDFCAADGCRSVAFFA